MEAYVSSSVPVNHRLFFLMLISFMFWWPLISISATVVRGQVIDVTTDSGIAGVILEVKKGDQVLTSGSSDTSGKFLLSFDIGTSPESQNLNLLVHNDNFVGSQNLIVSSGKTDKLYYSIPLLPFSVSRCLLDKPHLVVVGHFRSSSSNVPESNLATRVTDALTYSLLVLLQEMKVPSDFQPIFYACDEANPRSKSLAGTIARALKAHAFVSGDVQPSNGNFSVITYVGDSYDLFSPPLPTKNDDVNLFDSSAAKLNPETHAAILLALAVGYQNQKIGRFEECVDVALAADKIAETIKNATVTSKIKDCLKNCQMKLPNRGLLRGENP